MSNLPITSIILGACGLSILILSALIYLKNNQLRKYETRFEKLKQSFNELDEQAKLIVKTGAKQSTGRIGQKAQRTRRPAEDLQADQHNT